MNIQTMSVVVGSSKCNATCPYCVSRMTQHDSIDSSEINFRNFRKACRYAQINNVSTVLLTGKGEPTLHPDLITDYLRLLEPYNFPFIEIQTNGLTIVEGTVTHNNMLEWYKMGLTTIAVSIAHYDSSKNSEVLFGGILGSVPPEYVIEKIHNARLAVRLTCIMTKGNIDSADEVINLINFAKENNVEQLTILPVKNAENSSNEKVSKWISEHEVDMEQIFEDLNKKVIMNEIYKLPHGAVIYDIDGQNLCINNCLTLPQQDTIRQLIFYPDGSLTYDWQYKGARLL